MYICHIYICIHIHSYIHIQRRTINVSDVNQHEILLLWRQDRDKTWGIKCSWIALSGSFVKSLSQMSSYLHMDSACICHLPTWQWGSNGVLPKKTTFKGPIRGCWTFPDLPEANRVSQVLHSTGYKWITQTNQNTGLRKQAMSLNVKCQDYTAEECTMQQTLLLSSLK